MILLFGFAKIKFLLYSVKKKLPRQIIFSTPIFVRHSREFVNIYVRSEEIIWFQTKFVRYAGPWIHCNCDRYL